MTGTGYVGVPIAFVDVWKEPIIVETTSDESPITGISFSAVLEFLSQAYRR
jgi:hypothetical protein